MVDKIPKNIAPKLDSKFWNRIKSDMKDVINHENGTGRSANPNVDGMIVFGKTGTAENPHGENHAWFIGWAELDDSKYSIVVLLENSGSGGTVAAPVARKVFAQISKNTQLSFYE